jgi:hypothetical protein
MSRQQKQLVPVGDGKTVEARYSPQQSPQASRNPRFLGGVRDVLGGAVNSVVGVVQGLFGGAANIIGGAFDGVWFSIGFAGGVLFMRLLG